MYTEKQLELPEKAEKFKAEEELSQNEAGRIIGVSGSTLSQIKNGTYRADPQGIFDIIEKYFEVKEKAKLTYSAVEYAPTGISEQIYNVIGICQVKGGLSVVVGDAGIGKSKEIQKFTADNPASSFSITVNPCFSNIKSMLKLMQIQSELSRNVQATNYGFRLLTSLRTEQCLFSTRHSI